ncbi:decaprenyl diphosphate synthase subunit 2 [Arctopsyche grandis]|uniref:decaprenyl diphosphate synthase subunit 2 n=1 Tax=Arctopsyche grandis TaxID=121162 RepID=UPI00406D89C7
MSLSRLAVRGGGGARALLGAFQTPETRSLNRPAAGVAAIRHDRKPDWNRAVSEAEKIVGYPTSFLSLRWLLSDEIANVALHLRKLVGSNHPLLKTAKNLLYNGKNNMQAWGLIVLLVSKAAGHSPEIPDMEQDKSAGVLHSQRALAEVTEMIRTSHLVHKGLVNLNVQDSSSTSGSNLGDMTFGNKIALLSGDYLLGNSCAELAGLRNQELVELMSSAVRDLTEAEFIGDRDEQNNPLPCKPIPDGGKPPIKEWQCRLDPLNVSDLMGHAAPEWAARHELSAGALLGKSCQGALMLAKQSRDMQKLGYKFGSHLALAWQACLDLEPFSAPCSGPFSLVSAPVMFTLAHQPHLYNLIDAGKRDVNQVDYDKLHKEVLAGPGVEQARQLQREHSMAATQVLQNFPNCDACTALHNIILAMQDV